MGTRGSFNDCNIYSIFYVLYVCTAIQDLNFNNRFSHESAADFSFPHK